MQDYVRRICLFLSNRKRKRFVYIVFPDQKKGSDYLRIIGIRFSNIN